MRLAFTIVFLLISLSSFAQNIKRQTTRIDKKIKKIEKELIDVDSVFFIVIDTIKIDIKIWDNKIFTSNHFLRSNSFLEVYYYLWDNELIYIYTVEESPLAENMGTFSFFYVFGGDVIYENHGFSLMSGISHPEKIDKYVCFGYNETFTEKFLREYSMVLYDIIKPTTQK